MQQLIVLAFVVVSAHGLALWSPDYGYLHGHDLRANDPAWPYAGHWGAGWPWANPALTVLHPDSGTIDGNAEVPAEGEEAAPAEEGEEEEAEDPAAHKIIVPPFNPFAYGAYPHPFSGGYGAGYGLGYGYGHLGAYGGLGGLWGGAPWGGYGGYAGNLLYKKKA